MKMFLDAVIQLSLLALAGAKLTNESWIRFPYDAPVRFHPTDLFAIVFLAALVARIRMFPHRPTAMLAKLRDCCAATQREGSATRTAVVAFVLFFGFHFAVHVLRHWSFNTELCDQSFLHQSLFWPWDGRPLNSDVMGKGTFLSAHLAFTLYVLTPLTAFVHVDEFVFLLQALVIAIPLWVAFRQGPLKDLSRYWVSTFVVIACHAALRNGLVWDFREDCLAFCFLLLAITTLVRGKIALYFIFLLLSVLSKEYISLITLFLALPIAGEKTLCLTRNQRIVAAAGTVAVSAIWSVISLEVLLPYFSLAGATGHDMVRYFPGLGTKPGEIVFTLLTSPGILLSKTAEKLLTWDAVTYVLFLVTPFMFFLRKGGWWLAPAIPGIMMNVLSDRPYLRFLAFHYDWVILPFLIVGLMTGVRNAAQRKHIEMKQWALALAFAFVFSGSWPLLRYWQEFVPSTTQLKDVLYLKNIPVEGVLGVGLEAIPHLSHVREIRLFQPLDPATTDNQKPWDRFWALNSRDWTRLEGHGAHQATRMVLNVSDPVENFVTAESLGRGWSLISASPSARFVYLKKNQ